MIDALTGETNIEEPVVSSKSGHVFEKRVIEKYLRDNNGKCPITDQDLSSTDLVPIKVNKIVKPRPPTATSIPSMLHLFQNEWDSLMLESFTLKQQLESVRQELSHALYQHDAACRVIARLIKERDDAVNTLATFKATVGTQESNSRNGSDSMEVETQNALREDVVTNIQNKFTELSKSRKKRAISQTIASVDDISKFKDVASHPVHSTSPPGILCVDIHPEQELILSGGADSKVVLFSRASNKVVSNLKGHTKSVTQVQFHQTQKIFFSSSEDKTARVWADKGSGYESVHVIKSHKGEVTGVSVQATGDYFATGSTDATYAFHEISTGTLLSQIDVDDRVRCIEFHPDGTLLGTGTGSILKIWDVKTGKIGATFEDHRGNVIDLGFSQNGYYLATGSDDNTIKLWDLRKLKSFHTFDLPSNFNLTSVNWDNSGNYLAASGSDIRTFVIGKNYSEGPVFKGHSGLVTDVKWGSDAKYLVSSSMDRNIKIWQQ